MMSSMCMAFWWTRADGFIATYYQFFQNARLPREIFRGATKLALTWGIPILLVANVPAGIALRGIHLKDILALTGMTLVMMLVCSWIFRTGLSRYASASS
jgi:ABC-2 type transport system permease protein